MKTSIIPNVSPVRNAQSMAVKFGKLYSFFVKGRMPIMFKDNKIFNSIVVFNAVDVVNVFIFFQGATYMFFHYKAVFKITFALITHSSISFLGGMPASFWGVDCIGSSMSHFSLIMDCAKTFCARLSCAVGDCATFAFPETVRGFRFVHNDIMRYGEV